MQEQEQQQKQRQYSVTSPFGLRSRLRQSGKPLRGGARRWAEAQLYLEATASARRRLGKGLHPTPRKVRDGWGTRSLWLVGGESTASAWWPGEGWGGEVYFSCALLTNCVSSFGRNDGSLGEWKRTGNGKCAAVAGQRPTSH